MKLFYLDDAKQKNCLRGKMGPLVGVGGIIVDAKNLNSLERSINELCSDDYGFPEREQFKWSPSKKDWMKRELVGEERSGFFSKVLHLCLEHSCNAVVAVCDMDKKKAIWNSSDHEVDAYLLAMERFHNFVKIEQDSGMVFLAKPSGGSRSEDDMLSEGRQRRKTGTGFVRFEHLAQNPMITPSKNSRLLQAADLVVSITTAMCAGHYTYARAPFNKYIVKLLIENGQGQKGGTGLKLHPDFSYANLYYWLLKDTQRVDGGCKIQLPDRSRPYSRDEFNH